MRFIISFAFDNSENSLDAKWFFEWMMEKEAELKQMDKYIGSHFQVETI